MQELENAVANVWSVEISYRNSHEEQSPNRVIDPYGVVNWNNKWYTIAFCHLRNEIRSFQVERIPSITRTPFSFRRPNEFSACTFFMNYRATESKEYTCGDCFGVNGILSSLTASLTAVVSEVV
ncbi:YafY family protein [Cohnella sp. AR92]|uniref:helix-turn-helix transcriptional regulator n=1 Tax=Cohnella sp. AR92 TaxID=648716 RepID=UPI002101AB4D|nr:WYL domain-containing protein [Cohnella sp. AR92]